MHKNHQIKNVKKKAYQGIIGAKRKQYCNSYSQLLPQIYSSIHKHFLETLKNEERISCKKGCNYCCSQHVGITVAHGIAIVDYLYRNNIVLNNFLSQYPQWARLASDISSELDISFNNVMKNRDPLAILENAKNPLSSKYFDLQVACPFLIDSHCSIYQVRPLNCAGHFSIFPCEWCSPTRKEEPKIYESFPDESYMKEMMSLQYTTQNLLLPTLTLPIMVYTLLVEGLDGICNILSVNSIFN